MPRVLIIDDDPDLCSMLHATLSDEGFSVGVAQDGPSALAQIEGGGFDLLLTDIRLPPPMDGVEIVRRARQAFPALRVLYISGARQAEFSDPVLDDFVAKPFNTRELVGCICALWWRDAPAGQGG